MHPILLLSIATLYSLVGALIFFSIDSEEMQAHVLYAELPAITSLDTIRRILLIVSCGFWLPALVTGCIAELWNRIRMNFRLLVAPRSKNERLKQEARELLD